MINYNYHNSTERCRSLVIHYEHVMAVNENISVIDRHVPSGYSSLVFNSCGYASIHELPIINLPSYFMVIPLFKAIKIGVYGNLDSFIVTCRASILSKLLSLDLANKKNDYYQVINNELLNNINTFFISEKDISKRISAIEEFFINLGIDEYTIDEIDILYNEIIASNGCISISNHIEKFDKSPRYFREHFIQRVGINAKTLARIVRVNYLWSMIIKDNAVNFQDMVFEGDYFDQAHLIHDFKKIIGETPSFFFKRNLKNVMFISGKI